MSEQPAEAIELPPPPQGDSAFASLMDTLVGDEETPPAGAAAGGAEAPAAGGPVAGGTGDGAAGTPTAGDPVPGDGAAGAAAGDPAAADAAGAPGDRPADWTAAASDLIPKLGELSTALEESTSKAFQATALTEVREEHAQYFAALDKHPRLLVGTQVPAIGKEGMETLRDTNDAREWQEAVKSILVAEVRDRASRAMEESSDFLTTVHASIELFQNNADLVPGTKDFDVELANRFAEMAKPYELRVEGKLQGYSIPVQPIIDSLRTQVEAERKAAPPAATSTPAAGGAQAAGGAPASPAAEPPQAGIASKAGNGGGSGEEFSALFGTIGLPNLQI